MPTATVSVQPPELFLVQSLGLGEHESCLGSGGNKADET